MLSNSLTTVSFEAVDDVGVVRDDRDSHLSVNSLMVFEPGDGVVFDDFLGPNISSLGLSALFGKISDGELVEAAAAALAADCFLLPFPF